MASRPLPHTLGHLQCPACEAARIEAMRTSDLKELTFDNAAALWIADRQLDVSERTHKDHQDFVRRLGRFFGEMPLKDIHIGHVKTYQLARQGKDATLDLGRAGAELINHEISFLAGLLNAGGLWAPMKSYYRCLKVPKLGPGRALSAEERERLIMCAASDPRWKVAYMCTLLTLGTTRGAGEIRKIKIADVDLRDRNLKIELGAKNDNRKKDFPMTDTMVWCCGQLLKRYHRLCEKYAVKPSSDHYLLPKRRQRDYGYEFDKPMEGWRSAWNSLCEKAGLEPRMYDLRHDSFSALGKTPGVADQIKRDIMGHVNDRMEKRYFHSQRQWTLDALQSIEVKPAPKIVELPDGQIVEIPVLPKTGE
jgi:integrase